MRIEAGVLSVFILFGSVGRAAPGNDSTGHQGDQDHQGGGNQGHQGTGQGNGNQGHQGTGNQDHQGGGNQGQGNQGTGQGNGHQGTGNQGGGTGNQGHQDSGDHSHYVDTPATSNQGGHATFVDKNLVNSWGLAYGPDTAFWVANNGSGTSTIQDASGRPQGNAISFPASGGEVARPTGAVHNGSKDFEISEHICTWAQRINPQSRATITQNRLRRTYIM